MGAVAVISGSGREGYQIFVGSALGNLMVYDSLADTVIQFKTSQIVDAGVSSLCAARGEPIADLPPPA
eukprot:12920247-Prorocentrum_lima.AAC.1